MKLYLTAKLPDAAGLDPEVVEKSFDFFYVEADDETILRGGLIKRSLISDQAVVWVVLSPGDYSVGTVRRGLLLARSYLATLPWTVLAETPENDDRAERFAQAVGFIAQGYIDDRTIHVWSA